jgi:hypothetical protein
MSSPKNAKVRYSVQELSCSAAEKEKFSRDYMAWVVRETFYNGSLIEQKRVAPIESTFEILPLGAYIEELRVRAGDLTPEKCVWYLGEG